MEYAEQTDRSESHAQAALGLLKSHAVAPNPINYTVAYVHEAGRDPELSRAIDGLLADGGQLTPDFLREAFERRGDGEIAAHLGETYWRLGRRNRARQAWLGGLEKDPEDPVLVETVRRLLGDRALTVMRRQLSRGLGGV